MDPQTVASLAKGTAVLLGILAQALQIYLYVLLVRVLLSWFPNLGNNPIMAGVASITDPYLNIFRGVIPPLGGIDLSAILAFVSLNLLISLLGGASMNFLNISLSY